MYTERALTLALLLVAAGYTPGGIPFRDLFLPRSASPGTAPAHALPGREAPQADEARDVSHEREHGAQNTDVELPAGATVVSHDASRDAAEPGTTPYRFLFLAPPSQRGPPALG